MGGTAVDRDLLGALGEAPWALLFFFIARSASFACASDGYGEKSKNLRKPANVGDRRFLRPKGGLPRGVVSFYLRLYYCRPYRRAYGWARMAVWVMAWHWLSLDKVAEANLNWMVTERSDSQFAGLVNSWTGYLFADLLNPEMQFLKSHLGYINYLTPIFYYIVGEYFPFLNFGWRAAEFANWVS